MPLQNRVDPRGIIFACAARGTFMGNRGGALHNQSREIVRPYASRRWITCLLEFKGRQRSVMSPGRYTELFFLDEAVAFAAGHRPCAECRRERFKAFRDAFVRSGSESVGNFVPADQMDRELHVARINGLRKKVTYDASLNSLPAGCFVQIEDCSYLVWDGALFLWSPDGYLRRSEPPNNLVVTVLTPERIVQCIRQGYKPEIHKSALVL